ncbi:LysR family transcriptional regulator [Tuanshanicoccus lijuaniae]|uniref:LysR family transcriptional regulator n=1 Tax=Aerococcaceae bacterium zg-1292 TaxID=2774330 RepID=UPI0019386293|nr:LysR family transcriptional regulator [Aerococcaceae bacterium zg-1292]QQA37766.1 LysR family transcriptional regulator [Aerococcaceae bacterium zg-1292]
MDINQLNYFINIVECGCNLSLTAKKIHISQSALSQLINNFENDHEVLLFNRKNGRLENLTSAGAKFYDYAQEIVRQYDEMLEMIRKESAKQKGTIRIGIPSMVLRVYFSALIPKFTLENPDIQIEFIEDGTLELRKMLVDKDLDYAVLLEPTNLDDKKFEQYVIQINEMTAFMSPQHPLAEKNLLQWSDIMNYPIATFNKHFLTHQLLLEKLNKINKDKQIMFKSSSWDYLIEATKETDIVTVLPSPINQYLDSTQTVEKHFESPIPFNVLICRPIKDKYSDIESLVFENIINYFYQPIID